MTVIRVPKLEMHLAYACNLRCESCSHYSNYAVGGILAFDVGRTWLTRWGRRLEPVHFSFLGGEPLLNPAVPQFLTLARELWPHSTIRLVTNGLLLRRCADNFWRALADTACVLTVSIHSRDLEYLDQLRASLEHAQSQARRLGFRCETRNSVQGWYRTHRGHGREMLPYDDGDPVASWTVCESKHCVTIENNALWKCPPLAHLPRVARKFGLDAKPEWQVPLAYQPLTLDASDDDIRTFVGLRAERVCGMCPARLSYFEKSIR